MAEFVRKMVIQRVRNPQDESAWVDIALTTELTVQTGSGPTFMRNIYVYSGLQLGKEEDTSAPFEVRNAEELQAAADAFAAAHPD